ncbi:DUF11 domain-containing protein, partial [Methanobrevibacter sp.]|uniref:DUF11 domain-containing protein n=1 Tax=Methanobrevibacter sp. TaxID=66852 RepID=UPI00388F888F
DHETNVTHIGDTVVWTINVTNYGPDDALNTILDDIIPEGLIYVGDDSGGAYDNETGRWTIGFLPVNGTVTLTIVTVVNKSNTTITRYENVSSDIYDPNMDNNNDDSSVVIPPEADLEVTITNDHETNVTHIGDTVVWTINVTNHGPDDALNTILDDIIPEGLIYVGDDSGGAYDNETGRWTIGFLPVNGTVTLTITTIVNKSNTTITRYENVSSDIYDPNMDNNNDDSSVVIPPEADLVISKLVSDSSTVKGDLIKWTIVVTNNGADTAVNVVVNDKLPVGLVYISDDSKGAYNPTTGVWTIGDLNKGESAILTIVTIAGTTNKTIVNMADVSSETYDPNKTNNNCNNSTTVYPEVDLALTIEPDVTNVTVGDNVVFTVTVVNNGPDTAINTCAYINLPSGLDILGFEPSVGIFDPVNRVWFIGDLAPGEKVTMLLNTKASISGILYVDAFAISDCHEADYSNNNDTAVIEVIDPVNPEPGNNTNPDSQDIHKSSTMPAAGNPLVMVLLSLLAIAGISLRRKN